MSVTVEVLFIFILSAAVITTVTNLLKEAFPTLHEHNGLIFVLTSLMGILLMVGFDGDFFQAFGYHSQIPYLGHVFSGFICGGGSNVLAMFLKLLFKSKTEVVEILTEEQKENMAIVRDDAPNEDIVSHMKEVGVG